MITPYKVSEEQKKEDLMRFEKFYMDYRNWYSDSPQESGACGTCRKCQLEQPCDTPREPMNDNNVGFSEALKRSRDAMRMQFGEKYSDSTATYHPATYYYGRIFKQISDQRLKHFQLTIESGGQKWKSELLSRAWRRVLLDSEYIDFVEQANEVTIEEGTSYAEIIGGKVYNIPFQDLLYNHRVRDIQQSDGIVRRVRRVELQDMLFRYPHMKEDILKFHKVLVKNNINHFVVYQFWTVYKFGDELHKGCVHYMRRHPEAYGLTEFLLEDELDDSIDPLYKKLAKPPIYSDTETMEMHRYITPSRFKNVITGQMEEYYPIESSHFARLNGRHHSRGIGELLMAQQAKLNQYYKIIDDYFTKTLDGIYAIYTSKRGGKKELEEKIKRNNSIGAIITLIKDDEEIKNLVENSFAPEIQQAYAIVQDTLETMSKIVGVTEFASSGDLPSSTKATTANAIVGATQIAPKEFIKNMTQFHNKIVTRHIIPYLIDQMTEEKIVTITGDTRMLEEITRDAVESAVSKDWSKIKKNHFAAFTRGEKDTLTPNFDKVVEERIAKNLKNGTAIKLPMKKDWIEQVQNNVTLNVDGQFRDTEKIVADNIQLALSPGAQTVIDFAEFIASMNELQGYDATPFIKTKSEIAKDAQAAQAAEAQKALQGAAIQDAAGSAGKLGGRPPGRPSEKRGDVSLGPTEGFTQ